MQWLLQEFEDTHKLADALDRLGLAYSWHKVVPFTGELVPKPEIVDPDAVIMFGAYPLWRYAEKHGFRPGVLKLSPYVNESAWQPFLLNGPGALFLALRDIPKRLHDDGRTWFLRPVADGKEVPGAVMTTGEIIGLAKKVLDVAEEEIPNGSLRHDTALMLSGPVHILREWRVWVVEDEVVTHSLYKAGSQVMYRHEIDTDAAAFAQRMVDINPRYAPAYVIDICKTEDGLKVLETNCINAAGFYAADLLALATAIDAIDRN